MSTECLQHHRFLPRKRKVFKPRNNDVFMFECCSVSEFYGIFKYTQAFEKLRFIFNGCSFDAVQHWNALEQNHYY